MRWRRREALRSRSWRQDPGGSSLSIPRHVGLCRAAAECAKQWGERHRLCEFRHRPCQLPEAGQGVRAGQDRRTSRGMIFFIADVLAVGIDGAQGTITTETFYWDLNDRTRAFYNRLKPTLPANSFPNMGQAGAYSAGVHYFKAAKAMGFDQAKVSGRATVDTMKRIPTDD